MREALDAIIVAARQAWPAIAVEPDRLAEELARRLAGDEPRAVHHDIWLAIACGDRDTAATALVDQAIELETTIAGRRLGASPAQITELLSEMRRIVLLDEPTRTAAIRSFTGRGDLRGYLRIIAARALVRIMQRDQREVPTDDDALARLAPALSSSLDPDIVLLRERHRSDLDAALREAIANLAARPRAVLRYHLVDGWSIDRIGERYGVHRSTASRWISDARLEVGDAIREGLASRLALTRSQVDSLVVMLTSGVDVSLEQLLR
jgi:RNA polymerase sigma-70 factor, ECF subfamily